MKLLPAFRQGKVSGPAFSFIKAESSQLSSLFPVTCPVVTLFMGREFASPLTITMTRQVTVITILIYMFIARRRE